MSWPAYLELYQTGELQRRAAAAIAGLADCTACPRECHVDRLSDETRVCRVGRHARVATRFPHFGEEDCLRGWAGSGTIFFSWCNLKCVFCQNWETSNEGAGDLVDAAGLAHMMLELQQAGCHNINFVSPEHVAPQILEALPLAVEGGLRLPIVYNTSAYDCMETLELLDGVVDIYMPDFKYWDPVQSSRLMKARDYPEVARAAITEMHRQVGDLELDHEGIARRGLLVRHLVMPGEPDNTRDILTWIATELSSDTWVNVMDQYYPAGRALREPARFPGLQRELRADEHRDALETARSLGLHRIDRRAPHPKLRRRLVVRP